MPKYSAALTDRHEDDYSRMPTTTAHRVNTRNLLLHNGSLHFNEALHCNESLQCKEAPCYCAAWKAATTGAGMTPQSATS
jgi:hypothetical protein